MNTLTKILLLVLISASILFPQNNTSHTNQTGFDNSSATFENGEFNNSNIEQLGNDNFSDILISGNHNLVNGRILHTFYVPKTILFYSGPMHGNGITQIGVLNRSSVTQSGAYNIAGIGQFGNSHLAFISQDVNPLLNGQNISGIDQMNGDKNLFFHVQIGTNDEGYVFQNGSSNSAHLEQYNLRSLSEAVQDGNGNNLYQFQSGSTENYLDGTSNNSNAYLIGDNNYAHQKQVGKNNTSLITSIGNNNGIAGDEIKTMQTGNLNSASIEEGLLKSINYNLASVLQIGNSNVATVSQEAGNTNKAQISESTDNNLAKIFQTGWLNVSIILQQ